MNNYKVILFLAALSIVETGCGSGNGNNASSISTPPTIPPTMPPTVKTYTVTVTSVSVDNKDNGETLTVGGFPVQGGLLTVE